MKIKLSQLRRLVKEEARRIAEGESPEDITRGLADLDAHLDQFLSKLRGFRAMVGMPDDEFNEIVDESQYLSRMVKKYVRTYG